MPDPKKEQKEQDWADQIPSQEEPEEVEKPYRDGSAVHECWAQDEL